VLDTNLSAKEHGSFICFFFSFAKYQIFEVLSRNIDNSHSTLLFAICTTKFVIFWKYRREEICHDLVKAKVNLSVLFL
jgi:hypothetical protein